VKTCTLTDVAIPTDRNVMHKAAEKKLKYKCLCIETHEVYDYNSKNWSQRNSNKKIFKEISEIHTRKNSTYSLKRTVVLGTLHIIGKHCSLKFEP
jgi:D-alanine-D-alanine ligase-like ATP-grasp enzyme